MTGRRMGKDLAQSILNHGPQRLARIFGVLFGARKQFVMYVKRGFHKTIIAMSGWETHIA